MGGNVYNAYDMIIPRAKELDSIIAASKNFRERGVAVERALDQMISEEKENLETKTSSTGKFRSFMRGRESKENESFRLEWDMVNR